MGLGDSIYLAGVCRYFVERGERLEVCSKWPEIFKPFGESVTVVPFRRDRIDILAHYSLRKNVVGTNQWQDCCIQAGIRAPWDLRLDWEPQGNLREADPYICVALPRTPMDRIDGIGLSLMPKWSTVQRAIDALRWKYRIVQIGAGKPKHHFAGIDNDLSNRTTVRQMLDIAHGASGFLGYCSFIVPLAEALSKPALLVWSAAGLKDRHAYVRQITPQKILSKPSSMWVMDDWSEERINEGIHAFLQS